MIDRLVVLSGPISSGKSTLAKKLSSELGMQTFKTRDTLQKRVKSRLSDDRGALQRAGERLDKSTKGTWVRKGLQEWLHDHQDVCSVVIDSVRICGQVTALREAFGTKIVHVHLTAPLQELRERYNQRRRKGRKDTISFTAARKDPTESQIESLCSIADVVIDTKRCTTEDVLARVISHLNVRRGRGAGYVDVLVGGQYGSEGKGQIAAYLSTEYDLLVRVGGPNAGHMVYEEPRPYAHHHLPSGTRRSQAKLLIGAGATIRVEDLLDEIADCGVESGRLYIDRRAMVISDADKKYEEKRASTIGSTAQGVGAATARRISGRLLASRPQMAGDIPELRPFLCEGGRILDQAYIDGKRVFLEGTQGTGLSLYHGTYPYVTSRDTTVCGCLAEAGIPWNRVRRAIMVCRTYPIRVQSPPKGSSGPMSQEIDWPTISKRSQISLKELKETERTTTTHRTRRVGEFDWSLLKSSALLNGPTDIALTFVDYLSKKNRKAKRFDQLDKDTILFIQEIERVTGASVSLMSTGFSHRSIIDRRRW